MKLLRFCISNFISLREVSSELASTSLLKLIVKINMPLDEKPSEILSHLILALKHTTTFPAIELIVANIGHICLV